MHLFSPQNTNKNNIYAQLKLRVTEKKKRKAGDTLLYHFICSTYRYNRCYLMNNWTNKLDRYKTIMWYDCVLINALTDLPLN